MRGSTLPHLRLVSCLTGLSGEDSEAVVPEATGYEEPTVHCRHEAVTSYPQLLAEVVSKMSPHCCVVVVASLY